MLLTLSAAWPAGAEGTVPTQLTPVATRDQKIFKRWSFNAPGAKAAASLDPRGVAVGRDGIIYVGLAGPQAVAAIDPRSGAVVKSVILDSAEIASTKELVTLRTNRDGTRLFVANGSDESATILTLPELGIVREITLEGEVIRDVVPDPAGRFIYVLGRRVHVFDATGETELHTLPFVDPMAIAAGEKALAIVGTHDFGNAKATAVALYAVPAFREIDRDPLETADTITGALFSADETALLAISAERLFEKPLVRAQKVMVPGEGGQMRMAAGFGDFVNSNRLCLPEGAGPTILALGPDSSVLYGERRCSTSGAFLGSSRKVTPLSVYGVKATAIAFDPASQTVITTERDGFVTIYKVPAAREKTSRGGRGD